MGVLRAAVGAAPVIFVVGKGGVGKTTAAAALALDFADAGVATHLVSTDPAHSLADVLGEGPAAAPRVSRCSSLLTIEEFDADARARRWLDRATAPVTAIMEAGTYLDADDVAGFTRLALPGLDEMMAVLRLVELAGGGPPAGAGRSGGVPGRIVVDTAPTGHTLRLLDAAATHAALARALRAMADKAGVVAASLAGRSIRIAGEDFIAELEEYARAFHDEVLGRAVFVISDRAGVVVAAETNRLAGALAARGLAVAAYIRLDGSNGDVPTLAEATSHFSVPVLPDPTGCAGLRAWTAALRPAAAQADRDTEASAAAVPRVEAPGSAGAWLDAVAWRLLLFAGKGGVGKTTCAAAAAVRLATRRGVLLCSTDPAGSLDDAFAAPVTGSGRAAARLRTRQVDAEAELRRMRDEFRRDVVEALERIGVGESAALDRRVIDALWDLAPPGIDEFAALAALLDAAAGDELVILDTAPTGHFLRLLSLPDVALDWTRQLMRIVVKYHAAGAAGGVAESLLRTARELRALRDTLRDPAAAAVVIVTVAEPVVQAETARLQDRLVQAGIRVGAVIVNRSGPSSPSPAGGGADVVIRAPLVVPPPVGRDALRDFVRTWNIVA